jgi:hypothetical protein
VVVGRVGDEVGADLGQRDDGEDRPDLPVLGDAGVIVLYAAEAGFFDQQEMTLLNELAGDVSFALQYISKEEQLHNLDEAKEMLRDRLKELEKDLRSFAEKF